MKKILLLPRWMSSLKLYEQETPGFEINIGKLRDTALNTDYVVGWSLGALAALRDINKIKGRLILVNPPLPNRSILQWKMRWLRYIAKEGLFLERQKFSLNPARYILGTIDCIRLLNIDFSKTLQNIPPDKITVISGKSDSFFCDENTLRFLQSYNIKVVEVESGHNWSEEIENTIRSLIDK